MIRLLILLALLATGCASAWPAACKDTLSGVRCNCDRVRFVVVPDGDPQAGRVIVSCDGVPLPVSVHGRVVGGEP